MELEIRLLGGFHLTASRSDSTTLACRKAQELLSYLLLVGGRSTPRELAAELVWPDSDPDTKRKQVRQALWNIHQSVDDSADERLVLANGDSLAVNPLRTRWCDAIEFTAAVEDHLARPADPGRDRALDDALGLYKGALLEGCYSDWCLIERERLESLYLLGLDEAAVRAEQRCDRWRAVAWSNALLRVDPAHERSHRRLMRLFYAAGDRTRALQQFDKCRKVLQSELGVAPSGRTIELYRTVRDDAAPAPIESGFGDGHLPPAAEPSTDIARELTEIRRRLDSLQRSLAH